MRKQFVQTLKNILYQDERSVLMLGDIGVYGFRGELKNIPNRTYNIGILEQSTLSMAAGMSHSGLIPFVHTIAPFMIERAFEQIKDDFAYQNLTGNFVSIGNSYDYSSLGCTHHCPADVHLLLGIPNVNIFLPGTSEEFDNLVKSNYTTGVNYYRLSEYENQTSYENATIIKRGEDATIICFGNKLTEVIEATKDLNVSVLYYNTVNPFDDNLLQLCYNKNIIVIEPFYEGTVNHLITNCLKHKPCSIYNIGVPRKFLTNYGTKNQTDSFLGLDALGILNKIKIILENIND
jgi:transketolase